MLPAHSRLCTHIHFRTPPPREKQPQRQVGGLRRGAQRSRASPRPRGVSRGDPAHGSRLGCNCQSVSPSQPVCSGHCRWQRWEGQSWKTQRGNGSVHPSAPALGLGRCQVGVGKHSPHRRGRSEPLHRKARTGDLAGLWLGQHSGPPCPGEGVVVNPGPPSSRHSL